MNGVLERHVKQFAELKAISTLQIGCCAGTLNPFTSTGIIQLIQGLVELGMLLLHHLSFEWDQQTYDRVVDVCRKRIVKVQLIITSKFPSGMAAIRQNSQDREYVELKEQ